MILLISLLIVVLVITLCMDIGYLFLFKINKADWPFQVLEIVVKVLAVFLFLMQIIQIASNG